MKSRHILQTMVVTLLLSLGSVMAQDKPVTTEKQTLTDGTFRLLWSKLNVDFRKVVKGAPYSAIAVSEHTQTLSDGNQIIRKSSATYFRDSEGRIRTEQKLDNIGNWTATGNASQLIMIADPVAGRSFTLDPVTRTGRENSYGAGPNPELVNEMLAQAKQAVSPAPAKSAAPPKPPAPAKEASPGRARKESLGTQVIEGVEVEGTRTTLTIPAGEIGNTRPIEIVDESWYSAELQLRVMIVHRDPRSGESTFRLTNINRNEPVATLFEVPTGYNVQKGTEPKPRKTVPD